MVAYVLIAEGSSLSISPGETGLFHTSFNFPDTEILYVADEPRTMFAESRVQVEEIVDEPAIEELEDARIVSAEPRYRVPRYPLKTVFLAGEPRGNGTGSTPSNAAALYDIDKVMKDATVVTILGDEEIVVSETITITKGGFELYHRNSDGSLPSHPITAGRDFWQLPADPEETTDTAPENGFIHGINMFQFASGVSNAIIHGLRIERCANAFTLLGNHSNLIFDSCTTYNLRRFLDTTLNTTVSDISVYDLNATGFSDILIRARGNGSNWHVRGGVWNSGRQDGDEFAVGMGMYQTVSDVLIDDVEIMNCHDSHDAPYWNADGISTEEDNARITIRKCRIHGCTDGGIDTKGHDVIIEDCHIYDNKLNLRLWNNYFIVRRCTFGEPNHRGGGGKQNFIGLYANDDASPLVLVDVLDCSFTAQNPTNGIGTNLFDFGGHNLQPQKVYGRRCTFDLDYLIKLKSYSNGTLAEDTTTDWDVEPYRAEAPMLTNNPYGLGATIGANPTVGKWPTGWTGEANQNGLVLTLGYSGDTMTLQITGTATGSARIDIDINDASDVTSADGVAFDETFEVFAELSIDDRSGSLGSLVIYFRLQEKDASYVTVGSGTGEILPTSNIPQMFRYRRLLQQPTVARLTGRISIEYVPGYIDQTWSFKRVSIWQAT